MKQIFSPRNIPGGKIYLLIWVSNAGIDFACVVLILYKVGSITWENYSPGSPCIVIRMRWRWINLHREKTEKIHFYAELKVCESLFRSMIGSVLIFGEKITKENRYVILDLFPWNEHNMNILRHPKKLPLLIAPLDIFFGKFFDFRFKKMFECKKKKIRNVSRIAF